MKPPFLHLRFSTVRATFQRCAKTRHAPASGRLAGASGWAVARLAREAPPVTRQRRRAHQPPLLALTHPPARLQGAAAADSEEMVKLSENLRARAQAEGHEAGRRRRARAGPAGQGAVAR